MSNLPVSLNLVSLSYRKAGDQTWSKGMNLLRVFHEIANQDFGPYRTGNLFAGSVLFLKPGTRYEVRLTMNDPDGGSPGDSRVVNVSTRSELKVFKGGRRFMPIPTRA